MDDRYIYKYYFVSKFVVIGGGKRRKKFKDE